MRLIQPVIVIQVDTRNRSIWAAPVAVRVCVDLRGANSVKPMWSSDSAALDLWLARHAVAEACTCIGGTIIHAYPLDEQPALDADGAPLNEPVVVTVTAWVEAPPPYGYSLLRSMPERRPVLLSALPDPNVPVLSAFIGARSGSIVIAEGDAQPQAILGWREYEFERHMRRV